MSATSRPDWGRASGALSTLTAIDGREPVSPLWSGRPVSGARGPSLTAPSDTAVLFGLVGAAPLSPPPPPPQAEAARETRPMTTTGVRMRMGVSKAQPCCSGGDLPTRALHVPQGGDPGLEPAGAVVGVER